MSSNVTYLTRRFVKIASEVARRFSQRAKYANIGPLVETRIPAVVDNLIARGIIDSDSKQAMLNSLRDHSRCLLLIDQLSERFHPTELGRSYNRYQSKAAGNGEDEATRGFKELLFS